MSKKKLKEFKAFPNISPRPSKAKKATNRLAKGLNKKTIEKQVVIQDQKDEIQPLLEQLKDGTYISSRSEEKFENLVQLIINLK